VSIVHISVIISDRLKEIAAKVKAGESVEETVRTLLSWFFAYRRSWRNVKLIRETLDSAGLITVPDFESAYIDNLVSFRLKEEPQPKPVDVVVEAPPLQLVVEQPGVTVRAIQLADPAHRISRLASANRQPVSVPPDGTIEQAITLMLRYDYSQLPVMQSPAAREARGLFSWKSLGSRLGIGRQCTRVGDSMDHCPVISSNASLFDAIKIIAEHDCVLVQASDKTISGIVTAYDISKQFQQLAEPFLLLGDIENHVRYLIDKTFTLAELQQAKDPEDPSRDIQCVSDLTFGEYVHLLQNAENWAKLQIKIDRKTFTDWLDKVRETRNDVMHFDPDPLDPEDLQLLRDFSNFLSRWQQITS
jgi:predicted transcriptional regulator